MIAILFLQYAAVANRLQHQPFKAHFNRTSRKQAYKTWLGIGAALAIHIAWLTVLPEHQSEMLITPPHPIMVNWIDSAVTTVTATLPAAKPLVQPERPLKQPKPKPVAKVAKPKAVLATTSETASSMAAPISEPEQQHSPAQTAAEPKAVATSSASSSQEPSNQAPATLPSLHADYLNNSAPTYPPESRQLGEQGKVLLRVLVKADGSVEQVNLRKSSGYDRLDSSALETVKQWRFVPAKRADQAIAAWVIVPISFSLEG
jgi:protein TonB